jgi:hypothetical protein
MASTRYILGYPTSQVSPCSRELDEWWFIFILPGERLSWLLETPDHIGNSLVGLLDGVSEVEFFWLQNASG